MQGLELGVVAPSLFQRVLRLPGRPGKSLVVEALFLLDVDLDRCLGSDWALKEGVEAGSGTECVSINPQPEFHLDELWQSIPEAWAGPQYLCKAVLPGCVHGLCSWRGRKLLRALRVVFSV